MPSPTNPLLECSTSWVLKPRSPGGASPVTSAQSGGHLARLAHQAVGVGTGPEAEAAVEAGRLVVDSVYDNKACGGAGRGIHGSLQCVEEQLSTQSLALEGTIEREAGQQDCGDGVWRPVSDPFRHVGSSHQVGGQGEVQGSGKVLI